LIAFEHHVEFTDCSRYLGFYRCAIQDIWIRKVAKWADAVEELASLIAVTTPIYLYRTASLSRNGSLSESRKDIGDAFTDVEKQFSIIPSSSFR
jgi:hypothetical protein